MLRLCTYIPQILIQIFILIQFRPLLILLAIYVDTWVFGIVVLNLKTSANFLTITEFSLNVTLVNEMTL